MFRFLFICITFITINLISRQSYSLVGVENIPTQTKTNVPNRKPERNISTNTNKGSNTNKKQANKLLQTGKKPDNIPEFPNDGEKEYKMLFDEGFSNVVDDSFQDGEEWDIFINQESSNELNKKYISGNNNEITQMEVIDAEEKTIVDKIILDKGNINTHRRRVMAYLTLDHMLFADILDQNPHGYYVNAMNKAG